MPAPEKHARHSPSSAYRWIPCSYSLNAPESEQNAATRRGHKLHKLAADIVLGNKSVDDAPEPDRPGLDLYRNHILANQCTPHVEHWFESLYIPDFGGTCDCFMYRDGQGVVYDLKTGKWPVEAKDNEQLLCYAALAAEYYEIDTFYGVIVQPKVSMYPHPAAYTLDQVNRHRDKVEYAASHEYTKAGDHCRFCGLRRNKSCKEGVVEGVNRGWR